MGFNLAFKGLMDRKYLQQFKQYRHIDRISSSVLFFRKGKIQNLKLIAGYFQLLSVAVVFRL